MQLHTMYIHIFDRRYLCHPFTNTMTYPFLLWVIVWLITALGLLMDAYITRNDSD